MWVYAFYYVYSFILMYTTWIYMFEILCNSFLIRELWLLTFNHFICCKGKIECIWFNFFLCFCRYNLDIIIWQFNTIVKMYGHHSTCSVIWASKWTEMVNFKLILSFKVNLPSNIGTINTVLVIILFLIGFKNNLKIHKAK